jgi:hypothetical protein
VVYACSYGGAFFVNNIIRRLNIAAAQLSKSRPSGSIHGYFAKEVLASDKIMMRPDDIDESVWADLPSDIQRELVYHHATAKATGTIEDTVRTLDTKGDMLQSDHAPPSKSIDDANDVAFLLRPSTKRRYSEDNMEFAPSEYETMVMLDDDENLESCHVCGSSMFPWAMRAHKLFHEMREGDSPIP